MITRGATDATSQLREAGRPTFVFGVFNAALPFWLIAWGEKHIDSTVAGIAQATVPIFAFVVALRFLPHERVSPIRWVGVAAGLVGVGVLTGLDLPGGWWAVAGTLAVVLSSLSYACAGTYAQLRLRDVQGPVLATGGMLIGGLLLLPFALFQLPDELPGWEALLAVAALAVLGTTIAQLVYFHMLPLYGNPRISLVAYVMPAFAIAYGALFLDEPITSGMVHWARVDSPRRRARIGPRRLVAAAEDGGGGVVSVAVRRARPDDLDFLAALAQHEDVQPFLAASRPTDRESILADVERSDEEPAVFGVFVIEADGERAGVMRFSSRGGPNRIAELGGPRGPSRLPRPEAGRRGGTAVPAPPLRGARLSPAPAGGVRLQRAGDAARRALGFVLEGRKRRAYLRDGEWIDGVVYGLTVEDLPTPPGASPEAP